MQAHNGIAWRSVDRLSIIAPLGIRFWDPACDVQVNDGLTVTAWPDGARWPATRAYVTPGGIYAFQGLPGLHDVEYPAGNPPNPGSLPATRRFLIEVTDAAPRFMPVAFFVDAPFNGVFPSATALASTMTSPPGFYLFSSPTRPATPLLGLVRAQISERLDEINESPAAHAVLEVDTPDGDTWFGLADSRGAVATLFPYPIFTGEANAASSQPSSATASQWNWPITLRIRYQPSALSFAFGSSLPELRSVLAQQPAAIWTQRASPPGVILSSLPATLVFGQELTMRSAGEAVLLVSPSSLP